MNSQNSSEWILECKFATRSGDEMDLINEVKKGRLVYDKVSRNFHAYHYTVKHDPKLKAKFSVDQVHLDKPECVDGRNYLIKVGRPRIQEIRIVGLGKSDKEELHQLLLKEVGVRRGSQATPKLHLSRSTPVGVSTIKCEDNDVGMAQLLASASRQSAKNTDHPRRPSQKLQNSTPLRNRHVHVCPPRPLEYAPPQKVQKTHENTSKFHRNDSRNQNVLTIVLDSTSDSISPEKQQATPTSHLESTATLDELENGPDSESPIAENLTRPENNELHSQFYRRQKLPTVKGLQDGTHGECVEDETTDMTLTKLSLSNGKYYIGSEAPSGYFHGKLCHILEGAKPGLSALFDLINDDGSNGFVYFRSPFFNGRYLAVNTHEDKAASLEEKRHFTGRLCLGNWAIVRSDGTKQFFTTDAAQFELFLPPINVSNDASKAGVRAIIRSVKNQQYLSVKPGGNLFATEKDPSLATVFIFEQSSNVPPPPMGIYHIRAENEGYLLEQEPPADGIFVENSSRRGLFRLSHNDDGTISLFSLTRNKYLDSDMNFEGQDKIAKFELRQPKKPSTDGATILRLGVKFLVAGKFGTDLTDDDGSAMAFEFEPIKT